MLLVKILALAFLVSAIPIPSSHSVEEEVLPDRPQLTANEKAVREGVRAHTQPNNPAGAVPIHPACVKLYTECYSLLRLTLHLSQRRGQTYSSPFLFNQN